MEALILTTVTITDDPLSLDALIAVADGAQVELSEPVRVRIADARAVVDRALAANDAVYGMTTQVGHGKDTRLTEEQIRGAQLFLIQSHASGLGPPLGVRAVRATIAARLNGIARGGSGASVAAAEVLVALLNHGVHPQVPSTGSVGAGDLAQLASIAQVAVGQGQASYGDELLPGAEALARAGIEPLVPSGKDGLALISSNAVSIGTAALLVARGHHLARMADLAAALSMEAVGANPSILHPAVSAATGFAGQQQAADHLRELLAGSRLFESDGPRSVQDALSFRVVPQVHGAFRHYLAGLEQAVSQELNAAADNPLASVAEQTMISNGNFHPMVLAIAVDALRIALTHVGQLSERRMAHLWGGFFAGFSQELAGQPLGLALRYPAAAVFAELKHLAAPATLDTPTLDLGVEDHASGAPLSIRVTDRSLDLVHDLLAIETLLARDMLMLAADPAALGHRTRALLDDLDDVAATSIGAAPQDIHREARERLARSALDDRP